MSDEKPPGPRGQWGGLNHLRAIRLIFARLPHIVAASAVWRRGYLSCAGSTRVSVCKSRSGS